MSVVGQLTRPCTIRHRTDSGAVNDYGDPVLTTVETATFCEMQQRQRTEGAQQGEMSTTEWLIVLAAGEEIGTADVVVVDGNAYEMVGKPWHVWDPLTKTFDHIEATVKETA